VQQTGKNKSNDRAAALQISEKKESSTYWGVGGDLNDLQIRLIKQQKETRSD
jgi:hypothetical protein